MTGPGDVLDGFTLEAEIGRGATSVVYRARDAAGAVFAVKVFKPHLFETGSKLREEAIEREVRMRERVAHRNVCQVAAWKRTGKSGSRTRYLVSEYVDGPSLERMVREGGAFEESAFRNIARQLVDGLAAIHGAGLLHRDIKPGNVLVETASGRAVIADFGVIRDLAAATAETSGTDFKGTWHYAAPESILRDANADKPAADVYSLGATFYEMLSGTRPFAGIEPLTRLADAIRQDALPVTRADIAPSLSRVVRLMLAKDPGVRPTLSDVARVLNEAREPSPGGGAVIDAHSALAALRTRLSTDESLIQRRRTEERNEKMLYWRHWFESLAVNMAPTWAKKLGLLELPGANVGVVHGVINNADEFHRAFPGWKGTGSIMIVVAAPGLNPVALVYLHDGLPDNCRLIRLFARGSHGLILDMSSVVELPLASPELATEHFRQDWDDAKPPFREYLLRANANSE